MTTAEIKSSIDRMSDDERFVAATYLQHLAQEHDPAYQAMLAMRMQRMEAGRKVTLDQARRIHQTLDAEGL